MLRYPWEELGACTAPPAVGRDALRPLPPLQRLLLLLPLPTLQLPPLQVLIHGCGPGARAFFPYDPVKCPECQGRRARAGGCSSTPLCPLLAPPGCNRQAKS